jgi:hypothetical protein
MGQPWHLPRLAILLSVIFQLWQFVQENRTPLGFAGDLPA